MRDGRILATKFGHFDMRSWDGVNASGIDPVCDKVLVLVDRALERVGSILVPEHERQTLSSTTGILIALGPQAFEWNSTRTQAWNGAKPAPGTRVVFTRYAGQEYTGMDGEMYRVMDDVTIGGTMGSALVEAGSGVVAGGAIIAGAAA